MTINIIFEDFLTSGYLWNCVEHNYKTIMNIRNIFSFNDYVRCKVFNSLKDIESFIQCEVPNWVKGFSTLGYIGILNVENEDNCDTISQIFIHEFVHCAMYKICNCQIPIYIKEGIPIYFAGQVDLENSSILSIESLLALDWSDSDILYSYSGMFISHIDNKGLLDDFIINLNNPDFEVEKYLEEKIVCKEEIL